MKNKLSQVMAAGQCKYVKNKEQAGAELCQAQEMLGLARNCVRLPLI